MRWRASSSSSETCLKPAMLYSTCCRRSGFADPAVMPGAAPPGGCAASCAGVHGEEVRRAVLGPLERSADELAEQRRRAVRAALELGVGLGADPERVTLELDELDEPVVR